MTLFSKKSPASGAINLSSTPTSASMSNPSASKRPRSPSNAAKVKAKRPRLLKSHELVTLHVREAPDTESFKVHKEIACFYSPVLKAAFESPFIEGQTQTYILNNVTQEAVQLLVDWLYFQNIDLEQLDTKPGDENTKIEAMVQLWVLADRLLIPTLQNLLIRELDKWHVKERKICDSAFNFLYENSASDCPLRLFFVHQVVCSASYKIFLLSPSRYPKQMLLEIVTLQQKHARSESILQARTGYETNWRQYEVAEPDVPGASSHTAN